MQKLGLGFALYIRFLPRLAVSPISGMKKLAHTGRWSDTLPHTGSDGVPPATSASGGKLVKTWSIWVPPSLCAHPYVG
jgi:hypothetical protein